MNSGCGAGGVSSVNSRWRGQHKVVTLGHYWLKVLQKQSIEMIKVWTLGVGQGWKQYEVHTL